MNQNVEIVVEVTGETGDLGEMGKVTVETVEVMGEKGELGEKGVVAGELGGGLLIGNCKNIMTDVGGRKIGKLEKEAAAADTRDGEADVSDCSEVSHTQIADSQENRL